MYITFLITYSYVYYISYLILSLFLCILHFLSHIILFSYVYNIPYLILVIIFMYITY